MRVAFIHPFLYRYTRGIERYTIGLANALVRRGAQVSILTWKDKRQLHLVGLDDPVRVYEIPHLRYYVARTVIPLYWLHLLKHSYDVIIIHFAGYGEAEAIALTRLFRRLRYDIVFHYPYQQVPHRYREFLRFGIAKNAECIISVSRYVAEGVKEFFGRESIIISHGVEVDKFTPNPWVRQKVRRALGLDPESEVLITACALEERKGVQWVLQALPAVVRAFPRTTYLVLGDGPYRSYLEALAAKLGLTKHVRFLGARPDVERYYQAADISLILARGEASSLFTLESLACEIPVIAARQRPFDELIQPGWGIMVNEEDDREVSEAICLLLGNPPLRQRMGEEGRRHVLAHHTWDVIAEQYLAVFEAQLRGDSLLCGFK
jgi:phosphatidylinositol alpha-1,6-mannosyltransferase